MICHFAIGRACALIVLLSLGCSSGTVSGVGATGDSVGTALDSTVTGTETLQDGVGTDVATDTVGKPDVADDAASDVDTATPDVSPTDTGALCPGASGCPCVDAADCENALCIQTPDGNACAVPCTDACSNGYKCALVTGGGNDVQTICVPRWLHLCDPCSANKDCDALGVQGARCVDHGADGHFCGSPCAALADCPTGYACTAVGTGNGNKQCVPDAGQGAMGTCMCSALAIAGQLSTTCSLSTAAGTCVGNRACGPDGLSACNAPAPSTETCDGTDNNCDGVTDEGQACTDDNPCTGDSCGGKAGCQHAPVSGQPCAATSVCTVGGTCQAGACVGGLPKDCNDGNPCTVDACEEAQGCVHSANNGVPCTDGLPCTVGDTCGGGVCQPGPVKACATGNACVVGSCDAANGNCAFTNAGSDALCDDANPCTANDHCLGGGCAAGTLVDCDDQNVCTTDACGSGGCTHTANTAPCDDGVPCTEGDACANEVCTAGMNKDCSDGSFCTLDACDYGSGLCTHSGALLDGSACDADGDSCTVGDACKGGACVVGTGKVCVDGLPCTVDGCLGGVCTFSALAMEGTGCNADDSACTVNDQCVKGVCVPGAPAPCDDGNPCTTDSCDPMTSCAHTLNTTSCNDDNACTSDDTCALGICAGAALVCQDGVLCTDDNCAPSSGCVYTPNALVCSDGTACTQADVCAKGACVGTAVTCEDNNPCTTDSCDSVAGCLFAFNTAPCTDGLACTTGDACVSGACVGSAVTCEDNNACTEDACNPSTGLCVFLGAPLDGNACDADGSVCTVSDKCNGGVCTPGLALSCNDGNACTTESCDATQGCQTAQVADYTVCATGWCLAQTCTAIAPPTAPGVAIVPSPAAVGAALTCTVTTPSTALSGTVTYTYAWTRNGSPAGTGASVAANTTAQCETWACSVTPHLLGVAGSAGSASLVVGKLAAEVCSNGVDDNCNGQTDEGCTKSWQLDNAASTMTGWVGTNLIDSPTTRNCPAGQVAVGYTGASGAWFDHFELLCKTIDASGVVAGGLSGTGWLGTSVGPTPFGPGYCPAGRVLVRMGMMAGDQLNAVTGYCLTPAQVLAQTATSSASAGPSFSAPGGSPYNVSCPPGTLITGMTGYAGQYPHTVQFKCTPLVFQ